MARRLRIAVDTVRRYRAHEPGFVDSGITTTIRKIRNARDATELVVRGFHTHSTSHGSFRVNG